MRDRADEGGQGRVVFVGHTAVLSGAELCLLDIATRMPGALVCLFADGPLAAALRARGVEVQILGERGSVRRVRRDAGLFGALAGLPAAWRLARELARLTRPEDVVYANTQKAWIVCVLLRAEHGRTVIWHLHDLMSAAHFSRLLLRTAVLLANRFAAAVVVNSKVTGETFVAAGGRRELLRVVYNGIDAAPFDAVVAERRSVLRRELGLNDVALTIGVFGRIARWKGQHVLLEALERLPEVHALVVGAPLFGEVDYLAELERRARYPSLAGRVHFVGFREDVPDLMRCVDVVAHTSTSPEPFGRVIVEAMLARKPVVATAAGGVLEIVDDQVDGLLVPPADAGALAAAVTTLTTDPRLCARLVAAGREKAGTRFTLDKMLSEVGAVVDDVRLSRRRHGSEAGLAPEGERSRGTRRIALVGHSAEPSGAELSLIDIAAWLGDDAGVFLFQQGPVVDMLRGRGVHVEVLESSRRLLGLRSRARTMSILLAVPDVVALALALRRHACGAALLYANSQKAWVVAALVAWWDRKPVIWHLRDILSSRRFSALQRHAAIFLANRVAARVLVNSAATGEAFIAAGGRRDLLRIVYNGIDEAPFDAVRDSDAAQLRRKFETGDALLVGLFGRLAPWKGQHVLLEALERLPDVNALVVGDALFGEHEYRERLHTQADHPVLRGRVKFLGYRTDVAELMKAVDVVVHTSTEPEPFGRVIVEAMLAERPVIATSGGGVDEIVTHDEDGLLVAPSDPCALARAIGLLARDHERARRLAAAGRRNATERFVARVMRDDIDANLREIVPALGVEQRRCA
jgi:glycosyltransferase involved in cell wall biosynthesis